MGARLSVVPTVIPVTNVTTETVLIAGAAGVRYQVVGYHLTSAAASAIHFEDEDDAGTITLNTPAGGGVSFQLAGNAGFIHQTGVNKDLKITASTAINGFLLVYSARG